MRGFDDDPYDDLPYGDQWDHGPDVPHLEVEITDPDVVGTILGPDGEPIHTVLARPRFPFGFNLS